MIKAVIFDCFGVLTHDGWKQIREEFFADGNLKQQWPVSIDKAVNAGLIEYDEFINEIVKMTGLSKDEVSRRMNGGSPNELLFRFMRDELKPHYKIGMLSNAADNWLDEMFAPWQVALFDDVVLSYQVGMIKPEPAMYELIAAKLGVLPGECLFIDDIERYSVAAEDIGMRAILHTDTYDTIAKIKKLLYA